MKDFKYFPFSLQLKVTFQSSNQIIRKRIGFIISINDEFGNQSLGESSPLPEFSRETYNGLFQNLLEVKSAFENFCLSEDLPTINDQLSAIKLVPSLRFALEQAILSLMIMRNKNFVHQFLSTLKSEIIVNAVLGFDENKNIFTAIETKLKSGYKTFKIKVGRDNFEDDLNLISLIRKKFGETINIRLDANGKWKFEEAKNNLEQFSPFNIQYIEEPCNNLNNLIKLVEVSPIPIAVDESIHTIEDASEVIENSEIEFIILKPIVLGGMFSSFRLIKEAEMKNKKVIISSSFESAVGKSGLVLLAATTNHNYAHGLDTTDFFEEDLCPDSYRAEKGKITITPEYYPPQFNLKLT